MQLILASSSPTRRSLLQRLGLPFTARSPEVDETPLPGEAPDTLALRLALAKARALAAEHPEALIIGSDQCCRCGGRLLGKPGHFEGALAQLRHCSGQWADFHTAVVLLDATTGQHWHSADLYRVKFRPLEDAEIRAYLQREEPWGCAGSFKAEGLGIALFEAMEGADFHSLLGLPLISLCHLLRQAGLNPLLPGVPAGP